MKSRLPARHMPAFLARLAANGRRLVAPVRQGDRLVFAPVTDPAAVVVDAYTLVSAKEFLFPRHEPVAAYEFAGPTVRLQDVAPRLQPTVLFGLRPCDAAGLARLDYVFGTDTRDRFYLERRAATTVVTMACARPLPSCFCTAVGLSPTSEHGSDLLLTPLPDGDYLLESVTPKGEALAAEVQELLADPGQADRAAVDQAARQAITRRTDLNGAAAALFQAFDSPDWESLTRHCVSCGACTFVCPTCHCFDIVDEGDSRGGVRLKTWDCCSFALFTRHGAGHNPRDLTYKRCRQRYLHKLSYYQQKTGDQLCVGCGRCIRVCPVNLDIYATVTALLRKDS